MPVEIHVGPPVLTINQGGSFMVTDQKGEVSQQSEQGVFARDTRFVSAYSLFADGKPWRLLTSSVTRYYAATVCLANDEIVALEGTIPSGTLGLTLNRSVVGGIHEDIDITNYNAEPVKFHLEVAIGSDFADIFEVRTRRFVRRGEIETVWDEAASTLRTSYRHEDFSRAVQYQVRDSGSLPRYANGRITWEVRIEAGATWHACGLYVLEYDDVAHDPAPECHDHLGDTEPDHSLRRWIIGATTVLSSNDDVSHFYRQSVEDLNALRLQSVGETPDAWLPAAGVPWYVTVFGRDTLITSLQTMLVHPGIAYATLEVLASYQATERDDRRDAEPGKILHEIRFGELAHFKRVPHTPYYGTADATPLFLVLLHEAWKWTGDIELLRRYRETAEGCLRWIDEYGDLDGDGFQEYRTRSNQGYENVGWKDGLDSVVYPDGRSVAQPKALCELQGYVFDAWMRMAEVFDALDEPARATELRAKARALQLDFEAQFWCEELGTYAFGLDPEKQRIETVVSNAGHCLWSGIATPEHAARVVERLLRPDMASGWGIRTLSATHLAFNPFAYQRGSVWPHDNGIIALGFRRYGFSDETARVSREIIEAARSFTSYRLPELYAGIQRTPHSFPVQHTEANVPQAWAAGSVFHLLQALLGLQADAPHGRLYVDPQLPSWLPDIQLRGLRVGGATVDLRCWRERGESLWEASVRSGEIEVEQRSWGPW